MKYVTTINYNEPIFFDEALVPKNEHFSEVYPMDDVLPLLSYFLPNVVWSLSVIVTLSGDNKTASLICKYKCYGVEENEYGEFPHLELVSIFDIPARKIGTQK